MTAYVGPRALERPARWCGALVCTAASGLAALNAFSKRGCDATARGDQYLSKRLVNSLTYVWSFGLFGP